ncbi:MAG: hypothetical protein US04_C0001G0537 [Candidatus Nomurabacteria bacterium GW2011_GWD2_36_14]|nr:MAG: hypothetical protein UR97_C0002G0166 [Candidatus Nomurabacteria bacterium GW2011_GWE2_36_115]KKP94572.1 MAG: hypothetical protein US00_C0001G0166 [Candidatus Nomurabacteria bacterium GW2011_GWF2_36_126]KKP97034.1 MAG: hypothetical protein US04_C0001G0537 [Candidatus Nomurabacteria bacterium GW2011_GWD2_36_14]KKP99362.1 MAG: hypothetical protein US08_C0001G0044 [Candidatus Nomurabacteria bacterium GW2011_GWF2_36_19]KKQ05781.1 MAG: hypothetical protein US17_C0002G0165 [Candidatus Nomuraba
MEKENKICQNCKKDFTIESEDFIFYDKIKVPVPTFCPECRSIRRLLWRNEHTLYRRICNLCQKQIISIYSQEYPGLVYCNKCLHSDKWDSNNQKEYDFSIPFFIQFKELINSTPLLALNIFNSENCQYNNHMSNCKDCYLCFRVHNSKNMLYTYRAKPCNDCTDCMGVFNSSWLYSCIECIDSNNSKYLEFCSGCIESLFLYDCRNCMSCYMCSNLRNKQYCFMNEQLTKEEYLKRISEIDFGSRNTTNKLFLKFENIKANAIRKYALITNSSNVTGDNIRNSENCYQCFDVADIKNGAYLLEVLHSSRDSYDAIGGGMNELVYEFGGVSCNNAKFCLDVSESRNIEYCQYSENNHDLFGCVGLKHKEYCILNKQYTKEEYELLLPKIINHMNNMPYISKDNVIYKYGEFFPEELSPFAYNESYAQNFFPLTKKQAFDTKTGWHEQEKRNYPLTIDSSNLEDNISNVTKNILEETIGCDHRGECQENNSECKAICISAFKITPEELQFYKKMNIPLPTLCPNCRQHKRLLQKNPIKLWHRQCMCSTKHTHHKDERCDIKFETIYSPDKSEIVYCSKCYQQEIY